MIAGDDTLELPRGVSFSGARLDDVVRGCGWPLNGSGAFVLGRMGRPVDAIVRELADAFGLPLEAARLDVLRFVWSLNALALVNVRRSGSRLRRAADWIGLAARLAPAGVLPIPLSHRRSLDTGTVPRALTSSISATLPRMAMISAASTVLALQLSIMVGGGVTVTFALGLGTGIGLGLHEGCHVASLRGVPSALVLRGRRTFVLHAPVGAGRRALVAVAGPVVVTLLGVALAGGGSVLASPCLVILGLPLAAHALALTVVGGDGRVACGI